MKYAILLAALLVGCAAGSSDPGTDDAGSPMQVTEIACTPEDYACHSNADCCQNTNVLICAATAIEPSYATCMRICVEDQDCCGTNTNVVCGICRPIEGQLYGVCD